MPDLMSPKFIIIALLFAALMAVKFFAGNRPYDPIAKRPRRFGPRGTQSPLRNPDAYPPPKESPPKEEPPKDPEEEFFKGGDA